MIDICLKEKGNIYINAAGGKELYNKNVFTQHNLSLVFIKPNLTEYNQFKEPFVPGLSIIDVLMFNGKEATIRLLNDYVTE